MLKDAADWIAAGGTLQDLERLVTGTQVWTPPDGKQLLDDIVSFIRRYMVLSKEQVTIIVLWILHTHLLSGADVTPYININSSEKRCGKTLLLEILEMMVNKPWLTGRVTAAVLARKTDAECPTLLLDESDTALKGDPQYSSTLRGLLNTGYRRGGKSSICVGQGANIGYKDLSTFCPKATAGIGKLPDTVEDRSIPIKLKRKAPDEKAERFRRRKADPVATTLNNRIKALAAIIEKPLEEAEPDIPQSLNDRAADCIEPLLAIADIIGGDWPARARQAAESLMAGQDAEDESLGVKLLADIRTIFNNNHDHISSAYLIAELVKIEESPWADMKGKPINSNKLSALLKPFDIRSSSIRIGDKTPKGYTIKAFKDAWKRYLPIIPATPQQSGVANLVPKPQQIPLIAAVVADEFQGHSEAKCCGVAAQTQGYGYKTTIQPENIDPESQWEDEV